MKTPLCYSLFFLLLISSACKNRQHTSSYTPPAQNPPTFVQTPKPTTVPNDMQVTITEDMLNKCFKALGPISGKQGYQVWFVKDTFIWTLVNPQIHLHNGKANFTTDVNIQDGKINYMTSCIGDVGIWYDRPRNLINVKITKCLVDIYTVLFNSKYTLDSLDIADQFTEPFTFEGPTETTTNMPMEMPDGSIRTVYMIATDCDLTVKEKEIVVPCEVEFSLTPPPAPPTNQTPEQNHKPK
jgi:hypothetical protein